VEIQGSLLATLLSDRALVPAGPAAHLGFTLAPVLLLVLALAALPTRRGLLAALALTLATLAASAGLLVLADLWLPPAAAMVALGASYAVWSWRRLAVASHLVSRELERASREAGPLAHVPREPAGGVLDRQLALLADITARERELRNEHDAVIRLLSHDMRAPQSAILALLDSHDDCSPALAARLRSHARRTLDLADGFVRLSRAQLVELGDELIALADIAQDAADALWAQARARDMAIRVIDPAEEVLVHGDRSLLTRMLINLIDNAVKYGEAGTEVILRIAGAPPLAWIEVVNSGPDIAPDQLDQIFERFARGSDANRRADGFGLGLAFVQTVATRHGGRIACRSQGGETAFSVELPLARA
jgi:signal transduction histidine kinase